MEGGAGLWEGLVAHPALLEKVVGHLASDSPASIQQLRFAALPGNAHGDVERLLAVRRVWYHSKLPTHKALLQRLVELRLVGWVEQQAALDDIAPELASLQAVRLVWPCGKQLSQLAASPCAPHLTRLEIGIESDLRCALTPQAQRELGRREASELPRTLASAMPSLVQLDLAGVNVRVHPGAELASVAALSSLAGLRDLQLNAIPKDLARLTQITSFDACLDFPRQPLNLSPLSGLTGLRQLSVRAHSARRLASASPPADHEEQAAAAELKRSLQSLRRLASLELLHLDVTTPVSALPRLPGLRTLRLRGTLHGEALSQAPALTALKAERLVVPAAGAPQALALRAIDVGWCEGDLTALAPGVEHVTMYSIYSRFHALPTPPPGLRSLEVRSSCLAYLKPPAHEALAAACTRLALREFQFELETLPLCAAVRSLTLHLGDTECRWEAMCAWFKSMRDASAVTDLVFDWALGSGIASDDYLCELARWRGSLRRLVLAAAGPPDVRLFAREASRAGSLLERVELRYWRRPGRGRAGVLERCSEAEELCPSIIFVPCE